MVRRLYTATVPDDALQTTEQGQRQALAALQGINASGSVRSIGGEPGDRRLRGQFRGRYAERMAAELRELLAGPAYDSLALYGVDRDAPATGYYTAERSVGEDRPQPQTGAVAAFDARLRREGSRESHRRAIRAGPQDSRQVDHDFGSDQTAYLAVPAAAGGVRWLDADKTGTTSATPDQTVAAEFGIIGLYDITAAPSGYGDRPYLVYDLPHDRAGDVDVAVFDDYGAATPTDADGVFQWTQVFTPDHVRDGAVIVETGRVRITLAPSTSPGITAERWDSGTGSWTDVALDTSDWALASTGVDLVRVGAGHSRLQLRFRDTAGGGEFVLNALGHRGYDTIQFTIPESASGPIPSGLVALLDPIAEPSVLSPQSERTLIARSDLRA